MQMVMMIDGHEISRADFGDSHVDWVAFSIAFAMNTGCRDKAALLEMLRSTAREIVEKTQLVKQFDAVADEVMKRLDSQVVKTIAADTEQILLAALARSPYDCQPCTNCGKAVICLPSEPAVCESCCQLDHPAAGSH